MAAGKGTRMKNPDKAKVMYNIDGKPMIHYVVELAHGLKSDKIIIIVGHQKDDVIDYLTQAFPGSVEFAEQLEQKGTGHAVQQAKPLLRNFEGDVIVLSGDVPLLTEGTMRRLMETHNRQNAVATVLTALLDDPTGYGRVIRSANGLVERIVEQRDADEEVRKIREINAGIYAFKRDPLFTALSLITPENAQHEYYLPDVFHYYQEKNMRVAAVIAENFDETRGVNTLNQLKEAEDIFYTRKHGLRL